MPHLQDPTSAELSTKQKPRTTPNGRKYIKRAWTTQNERATLAGVRAELTVRGNEKQT